MHRHRLQLLRMSLHERLCTTTLLAPFQARTHDACLGSSIAALYGVAWVQELEERNHLAGSPPCRAEPGKLQQASKKLVSTFCGRFFSSTFRVSHE